jgi:hypothetical protein
MLARVEVPATAVVFATALLAGCGSSASAPPPPQPSPPPASPSEPVPAIPSITGGWTEPDPGTTPLVITPDRMALGDGPAILQLTSGAIAAADVDGGERCPFVPRLRDAIAARTPGGPALIIAADPAVPFRTLDRVFFAAGDAGVSTFHLAVRAGDARRVLPLSMSPPGMLILGALGDSSALDDVLAGGAPAGSAAPAPPRPPPCPRPAQPPRPSQREVEPGAALNLALTLTAAGVIVAGSGGKLAPGCTRTFLGRGVTVPRTSPTADDAGLATCLQLVKEQFPDETTVTVSADPAIPASDFVRAIAVARGTEAAPLFPNVLVFGVH